ncbi:ATP-dependent RecD-like DNA helicase [Acuticoccus sp. I52.16.1]|uniref:ATP-dependent DNA helicase n=1 Tax=Acuticoccus sp. I52.16.1 TaxID=2928472 RepID=UPI001FD2CA65|nr:AAA family ATPase [Acuticoccus sp. I52.16.1]UOM35082.1 AAA family ATPase [Acuticoccus sp. I52.16.1]
MTGETTADFACPHEEFAADQATAWSRVAALLAARGVDIARGVTEAPERTSGVVAVVGKAGSGKTHVLARLVKDLEAAGCEIAAPDDNKKRKASDRSLAIVTPTNKAASVLRQRGVPAVTLHRLLYRPVFDEVYQALVDWISGETEVKPEGYTDEMLERAAKFYETNKSVVGALAMAGLRGSDFISGWTRRDETMDIGFVDEASMLSEAQLSDLKELFPTLILFGDPAQLAPVKGGDMVFDKLPEGEVVRLERVHRQEAGSPILDLAHALGDPDLSFPAFEAMVEDAARRDDRIVVTPRVDSDLMARSPVLVWRNATRIRLITAFRAAYGASEDELMPGEPLLCDGIELPAKQQNRRFELEARGLIRGAQVIFRGPGKKPGLSRMHVVGADEPNIVCASIVKIERTGEEEPWFPFVARMGATFLHGAALTIHKAQGSQWPDVQVFAPDLKAAARAGIVDGGIPLWKRLTYVALTRAQERFHWVVFARLSRPTGPLPVDDLGATKVDAQEAA